MDTPAKTVLVIFALCCLFCLIKIIKSPHPIKLMFVSAISGIGCIFAVNILSSLTTVSLAVNQYTLTFSALTGPCGVIAMVLIGTVI